MERATRFEFVETPLTQVVAFLRDRHKLEVTIDEKSLADIGVGLDVPITMNVKDVRLCSALSLLLAPLDLVWQANQTGIRIMTPEAAESNLQLVFYRVDDLLTNGQADDLIEAITSTIAPKAGTRWAVPAAFIWASAARWTCGRPLPCTAKSPNCWPTCERRNRNSGAPAAQKEKEAGRKIGAEK